MFTFLHAADIHLDSPLKGLDRYEGAPVEEIRNASRRALENLVATAIEEEVAFVVLAGDQYDGDWRDFNTGLFFAAQMARLKEAAIRVFVVSGNHDAANRMTLSLRLPDNVTLFSAQQPETVQLADFEVAIHGQSFADRCTTADLASNYPPPVPGCFNLGILHTSLSGRDGHGSYAPCSEACLTSKGYDYWALGHIHRREIVSREPAIVFPGNLQGRHARELGRKGGMLVAVADDGSVEVAFRPFDVLRWEQVQADVSEATNLDSVLELAAFALRDSHGEAHGIPLAVRLLLVGNSPIQRSLTANARQIANELRAAAAEIGGGRIWVEKVKVSLASPAHERASAAISDGPLAEIASLVSELRGTLDGPDLRRPSFGDLASKLPLELNHLVSEADPRWWHELLAEAESLLMDRLVR